jgi:hypothetical protein
MVKQIEVDEDFLRNFIAQGGKAETPTGNVVAPENVDSFLKKAVTTPKKRKIEDEQTVQSGGLGTRTDTNTPRVRPAQPQTREEIDRAKADERQRREDERRLQSESEQQLKTDESNRLAEIEKQKTRFEAIKRATNSVIDRGSAISDRVGSIRTVGGIGLLLFILFVLLFTVVQVNTNGTTRLKQLWYLLTYRAELQGKKMLNLPIPAKEDIGADTTQLITAIAQVGNDELVSLGIAATQAFNSVSANAVQPLSDTATFVGTLGSDIANTFRIQP